MKKNWVQVGVLVTILAVTGLLWFNQQAVLDWYHLRGYKPPTNISQLATDTTMTPYARHLFYVNKPVIESANFTTHCPARGEKTVVLGCYLGKDQGIYLYDVKDERLLGVEQVTAAHEMLHVAYDRLSDKKRAQVNGWLTSYYNNDLHDERIRKTIESYRLSEPNDLVNEMHSIFATEIGQLSPQLETYYKQYFTARAKVVAYSTDYESEFTSRRTQVEAYDNQLTDLKKQIDQNTASLNSQKASLDTDSKRLDRLRASGQTEAYNQGVSKYNNDVDSYEQLRLATKDLIAQYNTAVNARNALVVEEQQLTKELSASSV